MKPIKIEMIHDMVCSWCPIGYRNIQAAISNLELDVDFKFLPFELNPAMPPEGESIADYFNRQMGWGEEKLRSYQASLVNTAAKAGVEIDFAKRTHYYNTHHAHLLMHWVDQFNLQPAFNEALITAYFAQGKDVSKQTTLLNIIEGMGLNPHDASQALQSSSLEEALNKKRQKVQTLQVKSIPAFIINDQDFYSGSNSVEFFEGIFKSIAA